MIERWIEKKMSVILIIKLVNYTLLGINKIKINKPKMAKFSKFKFLFASKWNLKTGQTLKEKS